MKKMQRLLLIVMTAALALACCILAACGGSEKQYTLTFSTPSGVTAPAPITAAEGEDITAPQAPTLDGYEFVGWYLNAEGEGEAQVIPSVMPAENRTYYAVYAKAYTLTFVAEESEVAPITAREGASITAPQTPIRDGYEFVGWYLSEQFEGEAQTIPSVMPAENRTYYAKFEKTYTLTFVAQGVVVPAITARAGVAISAPREPDRRGYAFVGWYLSEQFEGEAQVIPSVMPAENRTYYAKFESVNTVEFVVDESVAPIPAIKGQAGDAITPPQDPKPEGKLFLGWFTKPNGAGEKVDALPTVMPQERFTTYYAYIRDYFTVTFESNTRENVGTMSAITLGEDCKFTVPECTLGAEGMLFRGWTTKANGNLLFTLEGEIYDGSGYAGGEQLTLTDDLTLYAQWAQKFTDTNGSGDYVYVSETGVYGIGASILVREGKEYLGRVSTSDGVIEFTVTMEGVEGDEVAGVLLADKTFLYRDDTYGSWVAYDHIYNEVIPEIVYSNGYGLLTVSGFVGAQVQTKDFGKYEWVEETQEYRFTRLDPTTQQPILDEQGREQVFYFRLDRRTVEGAENVPETGQAPKGYAVYAGEEYGPYVLYENGALGSTLIEMDGYGNMQIVTSDGSTQQVSAQGTYEPAARFDELGEWTFTAADGAAASFNFVLGIVSNQGEAVYIYVVYNAQLDGKFTQADGAGSIELDGYGGMRYTSAAGELYEGVFVYVEGQAPNLTLATTSEGGSEVLMYFNVDVAQKTFTVDTSEFVVDANGVLTAYKGVSTVVEIPEEVNGITVTAIAAGAFNYLNTNVSLERVTIPATVTSIDAKAFQNEYTLRRVTFLGDVPPTIDLSAAESDPFRWPHSSFVIVVPEAHKDAYVSAFTAAWGDREGALYRIKGSEEVNLVPTFEVNAEGVLLAYNRPQDVSAPYDLTLTVGQTEHGGADIAITAIGEGVFMSDTLLRSIDLGGATRIGAQAFYGCTALVTVEGLDKVTHIAQDAFLGCEALGTAAEGRLELDSIVSIGERAFLGCTGLKYVVTGEALEEVLANAFQEIKTDEDLSQPFFFELTGSTPPTMAAGMSGLQSQFIFLGNTAFRIVVPNIAYALKCYNTPSWSSYVGSFFIPSGEEKGMYFAGNYTLELDGRAIFNGTYVWLYEIKGSAITFYYYDKETARLTTFTGTCQNDVISFTFGGTQYTLEKVKGAVTYTSTDGRYTLVVHNPQELSPDYWAALNKPANEWLASVTFNGTETKLRIYGYNAKYIAAFVDSNGKTYRFDITLSETEHTFTYTKKEVTPA